MTLLLINNDTTVISKSISGSYNSFWFYFSLFEFAFIILLLLKLRNHKSNLVFSELDKSTTEKSKKTNIDMNNLMDSINNSSALYKELSRKYHPDRFVNSPKQILSEKIFQEISSNKRNYEKLLLLKHQAENELDDNL